MGHDDGNAMVCQGGKTSDLGCVVNGSRHGLP